MAKRSKRRAVRYEKGQAGCISGLIRIFDFRHGRSTRKLLSDSRHGSRHAAGAGYSRTKPDMLTDSDENCQSIEDGEESETTSDAVKTSVKELMEEEMVSEQGSKKHTNSAQVELELFDSEHEGHLRNNCTQANRTCTKSCDMQFFDVEMDSRPEDSCHQVSEQKASVNLDLEVIMEELCQIPQKSSSCVKRNRHDDLDMQPNQVYSLVGENLSAAIKVFMNHRLTNGMHLTEEEKTNNSKEFIDALRTLNSNKELFLKLLQDPNSLLVKHIQGAEDVQLVEDRNTNLLARSNLLGEEPHNSRPEEHINFKHRRFFRRRSKSQESNPLKGNEKCQITNCSNKELYLKFLQDPNSLLVKQSQDVEEAQLEEDRNTNSLAGSNLLEEEPRKSRPEEYINLKHRSFFRRKSKSEESNPLNGNETCRPSSRIVILKPAPVVLQNRDTEISASTPLQSRDNMENKAQSERNNSQFSFTEIRRKLKHAMGKERHGISRNGNTHRLPYVHQNLGDGEKGVGEENGGWSSPNRNHFYTERFARSCSHIKREDKVGNLRDSETSLVNEITGYPNQGVSNIYIEAKKHLSEMLSDGDEKELMSRQLPKTLGRILSLPEYNFSPSCSPGKDGEHSFVTAQMRLSSHGNFHLVNDNTWRLIQKNHDVHLDRSCITTDDNPDEKVQSPNSCPDASDELNHDNLVEETLPSRDDKSSEGVEELVKTTDKEIVKTTDTGFRQDSEVLEVSCKSSSSLITRAVQNCDTAEVSFEEDQLFSTPSVSPSSSSVTRKIEDLECATDRTERPSPLSVLEPLFTEDDISPASSICRPVDTAIQPLHIHFEELVSSATDQAIRIGACVEDEESAFEYVEAVLLASDLNWDEFLLRWISSDQLLDPSLFDEVELFSNRSRHDQKLLFDCTNEVLYEVCERYFGCSFINQNVRPVPKRMNLIYEVWDGVEWHLLHQPPTRSLDQLVRKDMAKSKKWMDLRFETENIFFELGNSILEELMDDTILSFANDSMESELFCSSG